MDTLTELAIKYKTDKWGKKHHYTPIYYALFRNKAKRKKVKKVLEIGVAEGAGLFMLRDFFTTAMIYGAEICDDRLFEEDRIKVYKCDQSKSDDLINLFRKIGLDIDLIIDDGSHKPQDQVYTCCSVLPSIKNTIYIIEDVADTSIFLPIKKNFPQAEMVKVGKRYDDRLIIIRK